MIDIVRALALSTALIAAASPAAARSDELPRIRLGVITDGPVVREDSFVDLFRSEIEGVSAGSFVVEIVGDASVDGGWNRDGISASLDRLLARDDLDVIIAAGVGAAAEVCRRDATPIPTVVPFAFGDCAVGCSRIPGVSARPIDLAELIARDLRAFHELVPFHRLAVLIDPSWPADCADSEGVGPVAPPEVTVDFVTLPPGTDDPSGLLPEDIDAVYLMPLMQLDERRLRTLVARLTERGLPTFSLLGESEVDLGVFGGLNTRSTMASIARSSAIEVIELVEGRGGWSATEPEIGGRLTLNMATAEKLGISPSWELRTSARLLHGDGLRHERPIDLATAIRRAVAANLDLAAADRKVAAGAADIRQARSRYRPQVDIGLAGVAIDENHALAAFGMYARYAAGSAVLNQLIWSDKASADIAIQKELQRARELDLDALRLDIARDAVSAYMNVLRTEALVRIRRQQVDLTRTNLELARLRRAVGAAGAGEVLRWEAELATARAGLLDAVSAGSLAERQLSRLLDEPLTTRWRAKEPAIRTTLEVLGGADQAALLDTPDGHERLSSILVESALLRAPELAALDAAIAAQQRGYQAAKRASYSPDVGLQADLNHIFAKDTTGGPDLGDLGALIPEIDDTSWQVAVRAGLPVVTGGANKAGRIRAREELFALETDRRIAAEKLGQRALSALDAATASWSTISLRRQASDAAGKTLDLVRDAYKRGAASILDLLDAQNNALTAELAAETAVYDFLDDWAEVRRSVADLGAIGPRSE